MQLPIFFLKTQKCTDDTYCDILYFRKNVPIITYQYFCVLVQFRQLLLKKKPMNGPPQV